MRKAIFVLAILLCATTLRAEQRELWLYCPTNLLVDKNVDELDALWHRAAAAGYSRVLLADSKLAHLGILGDNTKHYFANLQRTKKIATDLHLKLVPALFDIGYSNDLLYHDPNLAEGVPVKEALFVVHNGLANIVADPPVALEGKPAWVDESVKIEDHVATVTDNPANARLVYALDVSPFRCYHVSVQIRTNKYTGHPEIKALADKTDLQNQSIDVKSTQDWTSYDVVFNSLDHRKVSVYLGIWVQAKGTLEWKDWKIEETGLVNVLRRPGAPVVVKGFVEGKDYDAIVDPHLGNTPWAGSYQAWHEPPSIHTRLPEGTKLRVSWYHPVIFNDDQVMCCISEPAVRDLLADQAKRLKAAFGADGYMMSHDEIRCMNWDESCEQTHQTPGEELAANVKLCTGLLGDDTAYVWSDMFDPFHNAHKDYYLVNGDLSGSWEGLNSKVVIVNWNFGKRDESLKFFADRGNRQVIAGYYDGDVNKTKDWLASVAKVHGVVGMMYTTWQHKYGDLEAFAKIVRENQ